MNVALLLTLKGANCLSYWGWVRASMEKEALLPQRTPAEREAENEASRLMEHIESALTLVAVRSSYDADSIETAAHRIENASRDLVYALRGLARERSTSIES